MRILVVSPYPLAPLTHGGRVRTVGLVRGLAAAGAEVTVLAPWHPRGDPASVLGTGVAHRSHLLPASAALRLLPARAASPQAVLSLNPRPLVRRLLGRLGRFDAYQFEFCAHAHWAGLVPDGAMTAYSAHNVERDYLAAERAGSRLSVRRVEALERRAVQRSSLVVACTEEDAARLRDLYGPHRSLVLPNGPSPALAGFARSGRDRARAELGIGPGERAVLFVGGGGEHNRRAAEFLAREVMPRVGANVRLLLAGASAAAARRPADERVLVLGEVAELGPLLAAADVGVNPALTATGSSVKVHDYLAAGLPVLATEQGARGIRHPALATIAREDFARALEEQLPAAPPGPAHPSWEELGVRLLAELRAARPGAAPRA